jgi:hypothetical protein
VSTWPEEELRKIAEADDLHIAPFREDGATYGTPTWIWSVAVDGDLYVRAYGRGTSACANHRTEVGAATVLRPAKGLSTLNSRLVDAHCQAKKAHE